MIEYGMSTIVRSVRRGMMILFMTMARAMPRTNSMITVMTMTSVLTHTAFHHCAVRQDHRVVLRNQMNARPLGSVSR